MEWVNPLSLKVGDVILDGDDRKFVVVGTPDATIDGVVKFLARNADGLAPFAVHADQEFQRLT